MQVASDILVIGSGITGLTAALSAAEEGLSVSIVSKGAGTIAISSDCVDLLGNVDGKEYTDPWEAMDLLPKNHPYRFVGKENIQKALSFFTNLLEKSGEHFCVAHNESGNSINSFIPTIVGTLKPSYLIPQSLASDKLFAAKRVLVCGFTGLRDISPKLCADTLRKHPALSHIDFSTTLLPNPFQNIHRGISALDIARHINTQEGLQYLTTCLGRFANSANYDVILLPPVLGTEKTHEIRTYLENTLHTHIEELLSIPPGVGGIRLQESLLESINQNAIRRIENCAITHAAVTQRVCEKVFADETKSITFCAKAFIVATGGILGGGITIDPHTCRETLFDFPIPGADTFPRISEHIFDQHHIYQLGVAVDSNLRPIDADGNPCVLNVFAAGRTLGGYDYACEKSGHGVAIATGWYAGKCAAHSIGCEKVS